jgi:hypothetical protein
MGMKGQHSALITSANNELDKGCMGREGHGVTRVIRRVLRATAIKAQDRAGVEGWLQGASKLTKSSAEVVGNSVRGCQIGFKN